MVRVNQQGYVVLIRQWQASLGRRRPGRGSVAAKHFGWRADWLAYWLKGDPRLDSLRSDPQYQNLLRRIGLRVNTALRRNAAVPTRQQATKTGERDQQLKKSFAATLSTGDQKSPLFRTLERCGGGSEESAGYGKRHRIVFGTGTSLYLAAVWSRGRAKLPCGALEKLINGLPGLTLCLDSGSGV